MLKINTFLRNNFDEIFVLIILVTVMIVNTWVPQKIIISYFYFLPVIMAGYLLGFKESVLCAVFCLMLGFAHLAFSSKPLIENMSQLEIYLNTCAWGGFLILAGAVVGKQQESLMGKMRQTQLLNEILKEQQNELSSTHKQLKEYSENLEAKVRARTAALESANRELKKAKKIADDSTRAKSQFLANMSHEIRTPMNAIIGMSDLVMSTILNRKQREYLNIVRSSSRSLLNLINDILDFSKIEAGKLEFDKIPVSIREAVEEVSDMFILKSQEKEVEFIVDINPEVPRVIITDPFRLRQVLINLVANAFKFTERGEICISVDTKSVNSSSAALQFCVRDTGIGIEPEVSNRLFGAFAQADGSVTRIYGGTGLGLAICKNIVKLQGGDIWVESEPGKGSSFFFKLAFDISHEEEKEPNVVPENMKGVTSLIVEDNPSTLSVLKRYLKSFGFKTKIAKNGENALSLCNDKQPGIVLIDTGLPDMDGIQLSEKIKNSDGGKDIPIIIMSTSGSETDIRRAKDAGVESFLVKPIKQSMLFDTAMELFGYEPSSTMAAETSLISEDEFKDINILLVEDNPTNQLVAVEILTTAGISPDKAENGLEAIEMIQRKDYDAVLMDIQMPQMDGFEATRIIRKELKKECLPVIAMTAHAMREDRINCLDAGMNDFVPKPIEHKKLFAVLRKNIEGLKPLPDSGIVTIPDKSPGNEIPDSLPGLNIKEGVDRLGISWEKYVGVLDNYCSTHEKFSHDILALINAGDYDAAKIKAHSLKGAAGNVAAYDLRTSAKILEDACTEEDHEKIINEIASAEKAFQQVSEALAIIKKEYYKKI